MTRFTKLLATLFLSFVAVYCPAQQPTLVYHPGETIHLMLTFDHPAKVEGAILWFGLQTSLQQHQRGLKVNFNGSQFRTISDSECEVSVTIPASVASGVYVLNTVSAVADGARRDYSLNNGFTTTIEVRVENPKHVNFPDIKNISISSGK